MRESSITELIDSIDVKIPSHEEFLKLGEIFKINPIRPKEHSNLNYELGMLLYALITKYKPNTVLEIGRAQGYSTMCMAWAMSESKIDGKIYSVDPNPIDSVQKYLIDFDNDTPYIANITTMDLW